jgi:hypothetical protein
METSAVSSENSASTTAPTVKVEDTTTTAISEDGARENADPGTAAAPVLEGDSSKTGTQLDEAVGVDLETTVDSKPLESSDDAAAAAEDPSGPPVDAEPTLVPTECACESSEERNSEKVVSDGDVITTDGKTKDSVPQVVSEESTEMDVGAHREINAVVSSVAVSNVSSCVTVAAQVDTMGVVAPVTISDSTADSVISEGVTKPTSISAGSGGDVSSAVIVTENVAVDAESDATSKATGDGVICEGVTKPSSISASSRGDISQQSLLRKMLLLMLRAMLQV